MPILDAAGLVEEIRKISSIPIIVVTGYRKAYHEKVDSFDGVTVLEKPFPGEVLVDLVEVELSSF